jgi:hypothetical protein
MFLDLFAKKSQSTFFSHDTINFTKKHCIEGSSAHPFFLVFKYGGSLYKIKKIKFVVCHISDLETKPKKSDETFSVK